ncbi:MAG: YtxH domain-containing protein [Thermoleophilia bacterium]
MSCTGKKSRCGKGGMRRMLFGMLVGMVLGLLFAPRPGAETLDRLLKNREKMMDVMIRKLPV